LRRTAASRPSPTAASSLEISDGNPAAMTPHLADSLGTVPTEHSAL
jgi:hypothetical protein